MKHMAKEDAFLHVQHECGTVMYVLSTPIPEHVHEGKGLHMCM